jgi:hypothetical protein
VKKYILCHHALDIYLMLWGYLVRMYFSYCRAQSPLNQLILFGNTLHSSKCQWHQLCHSILAQYWKFCIKKIEEIQTSAQADMIAGELERLNQRLLCSMTPPKRQVTRGRPQGALNRVIKRGSSAFEVAIALPTGVPVNNRRCKRCNIVGTRHNSATCPLRNKK